jgi:hypothetical protein
MLKLWWYVYFTVVLLMLMIILPTFLRMEVREQYQRNEINHAFIRLSH